MDAFTMLLVLITLVATAAATKTKLPPDCLTIITESPEPKCPSPLEKWSDCDARCQATCENHNPNRPCSKTCVSGCVCQTGLVRRNDGKCVPVTECEPKCPCPLEKWSECGARCQATCDNYNLNRPCPKICHPGCVCLNGLVRGKHGKCIPLLKCEPKCPSPLEKWSKCGARCQATCDNYNLNRPCPKICHPGCVCLNGLVRGKHGKCIPLVKCEPKCPSPLEKWSKCGARCQATCDNHDPNRPCPLICVSGCVCRDGFVRGQDGKCIPVIECKSKCSSPLEKWSECGARCQATCENHDPNRPCPAICAPGCVCQDGLVRGKDGECIPVTECEPKCPNPLEKWSECDARCQATCENHDPNRPCPAICAPGCVCQDGLVRGKDGKCIPVTECEPKCPNPLEKWSECDARCQATCENHDPNRLCPAICAPGCVCQDGLVRGKDGECIPVTECEPKCPNPLEKWSECDARCQATCENHDPNRLCPAICAPGCVCQDGLVRGKDGECIPVTECEPKCPNPLEKWSECDARCQATCENHDPNRLCPAICAPGCVCQDGLVRGKDGECIPVTECEPKCPNPLEKWSECDARCQATCENHDPNRLCPAICIPGCVCQDGLVRGQDGKCIPVIECPGNPCSVNETFALCKVNCPDSYCPVDDSRAIIACDPPNPCLSGCVCKLNYRRKSREEDGCILASECPPVNCTRPNEEWCSCPSACLAEDCDDVDNQPTTCNTLVLNCNPRCVCKKGHFRNKDGICIPEEQCPLRQPCEDPNAERKLCASHELCRSTCAVPNPKICPEICLKNQCECKPGYVLSEKGGKCIKVDECPKDLGCNEDKNAVIKKCPLPCPSTCEAPNAVQCRKMCVHVGCECKPGHILSEINGKCILPNKCKGGNPCSVNETFVSCRGNYCPYDYCPVDDSRDAISCEPQKPCLPGCRCKINYKRKSIDNNKCILAPECPPVNCTRPNEVWSPCPSACLSENCEDANKPPIICNTLLLNCNPRCICNEGYFRNKNDICIPAKKCPKINECN